LRLDDATFENSVTIKKAVYLAIRKPYILKLNYQVDDRIYGHCSGQYALIYIPTA
jgi:hypothetical protein